MRPHAIKSISLLAAGGIFSLALADQIPLVNKPNAPDSTTSSPSSLLPLVFEPLPLGSIKPAGWLLSQLQTLGDGLAGHEHDFYKIVSESRWLGGGHDYSDLNEALPYWFNGMVPLAYQLGNERLIRQVESVAETVLDKQHEDGWLGPETDLRRRNFWGRTPMVLGLAQMAEATEGSNSKLTRRIVAALHRYVDVMHSMLSNGLQGLVLKPNDGFDEQWGRARTADSILGLQWLFEKHPQGNEEKLLECMRFILRGSHDWSRWFSDEMFIKGNVDDVPSEITDKIYHFLHGVNAGQGLKWGGVMRRFTHNDSLLESTYNGVDWSFRYHGTPSGGIIADERLAGRSPVRGVELCSVVETMFSLSYLQQALGDADFADRCELTAFNALPVMMTEDSWAHQYVTQTNQPISHRLDPPPFYNVGGYGVTFGLQPNYPCCTVNHHQGYPKYVSNMFTRYGRSGIAHTLLGPGTVTTTTQSGSRVQITCDTNYPFGDVLYYSIEVQYAFVLYLRVPAWANLEESWYSVDGEPRRRVTMSEKTGMLAINLYRGKHAVVYSLSGDVRVESRGNDVVAIHRGPILYSVSIRSKTNSWHSGYQDAPPSAREYNFLPTSEWGFAIVNTSTALKFNPPTADKLPELVWAAIGEDGAGDRSIPTITATVCRIDWKLTGPRGYAPEPPAVGKRKCIGEPFEIDLVPYGTARLHVAELPLAD